MSKFLCIIGPDETYLGGMLNVIRQILDTDFQIENLDKIHIGTASKKNIFHKITTFLKGVAQYTKLCRKHQVAIAHIQLSERGSLYRTIILLYISKFFGVNTIVHSHGGGFYDHIKSMGNRKYNYIKKTLQKADRIIVLTEGWKKIWCNLVNESKIRVIPNGVAIPDSDRKQYFYKEKFNILFLGNINPLKGIYDLIDAIDMLSETSIPIVLRVAGGDQIEECRQYVHEKQLDGVVDVLGWVEGNARDNLFAVSDVLVLPSYFESFGLVAIEAMAHRIPVICGDKGFTKEIVKDGEMGFVCRTGDPKDIADKIQILYDKKLIEKFAETGYKHVINNYEINSVLAELKNVYSEFLMNGNEH